MFLLEFVDIDILFHLTISVPTNLSSPQKASNTSRYASIVQEIKNQTPPSPTSPINHWTTISPPVPKIQAHTPISSPGPVADLDFQQFFPTCVYTEIRHIFFQHYVLMAADYLRI